MIVRKRQLLETFPGWSPAAWEAGLRTRFHSPLFRAGFTLIEVLVAVVIMSIIAGAAAFSFNKPIRAARIRDAEEQVRYLDATARHYARRFGRPVQLVFELSQGTLSRRDGDRGGQVTYRSIFPPGYRIDTVRTAERRSSVGEVAIDCSALGLTPSYALHLTGPGLDLWVLVAGLSGEISLVKDEHPLDSIFQSSTARGPSRNDAD